MSFPVPLLTAASPHQFHLWNFDASPRGPPKSFWRKGNGTSISSSWLPSHPCLCSGWPFASSSFASKLQPTISQGPSQIRPPSWKHSWFPKQIKSFLWFITGPDLSAPSMNVGWFLHCTHWHISSLHIWWWYFEGQGTCLNHFWLKCLDTKAVFIEVHANDMEDCSCYSLFSGLSRFMWTNSSKWSGRPIIPNSPTSNQGTGLSERGDQTPKGKSLDPTTHQKKKFLIALGTALLQYPTKEPDKRCEIAISDVRHGQCRTMIEERWKQVRWDLWCLYWRPIPGTSFWVEETGVKVQTAQDIFRTENQKGTLGWGWNSWEDMGNLCTVHSIPKLL